MEQVSKISIESLKESKYMKPVRMHYVQNGTSKIWDLSLGHPSVAVVIYNKESDKLVLVKQLRPAVLFTELMNDASITSVNDMVKANDALKNIPSDVAKRGITLELCAGIVDKEGKSLAEIATEEVEEECGYRLSQPIEYVQTFRASIGTGGAKMALFYAEVSDSDRVSSGGGVASEGEMIEVVELSVAEVKTYLQEPDINSPTFTLYGLQWFLLNKNRQ